MLPGWIDDSLILLLRLADISTSHSVGWCNPLNHTETDIHFTEFAVWYLKYMEDLHGDTPHFLSKKTAIFVTLGAPWNLPSQSFACYDKF